MITGVHAIIYASLGSNLMRTESGATVRHDVGQRANVHPDIAVEGAYATDGLRPVVVPSPLAA